MYKILSLLFCFLFYSSFCVGQKNIRLKNPSFENRPHAGGDTISIKGWKDWGSHYFDFVSPPDIHHSIKPGNDNITSFFGVKEESSHGFTFLGLVARENGTYESVGQKLRRPLKNDICYTISIDLMKSEIYYNSHPLYEYSDTINLAQPIVLRIYGGSSLCDKAELLAESERIDNTNWISYQFDFHPTKDYKFIILEAYYDTSKEFPYNGNLLLDYATPITVTSCDNE